eukprot:2118613-Rhodomonas_salina.1
MEVELLDHSKLQVFSTVRTLPSTKECPVVMDWELQLTRKAVAEYKEFKFATRRRPPPAGPGKGPPGRRAGECSLASFQVQSCFENDTE